jgi:hypothetical protein
VRKHLLWASASLALIAACTGGHTGNAGSSGSTTASCVNNGAAHHAYVVVQHTSGKSIQGCVGFDGDQINGDDLMTKSGIKYATQTFSGIGKGVCQIDGEPATFTECFPKNGPYWSLLVETGGQWGDAQSGYTATGLKDGDALGWQYRQPTGTPPPPPPLPKK